MYMRKNGFWKDKLLVSFCFFNVTFQRFKHHGRVQMFPHCLWAEAEILVMMDISKPQQMKPKVSAIITTREKWKNMSYDSLGKLFTIYTDLS